MTVHGKRVLNLSPDLSAAYCARLLADAGAVVDFLPPTGDRRRPPGHRTFELDPDSTLARVLRRGQRTLVEASDPVQEARSADLVIDCGRLSSVDVAALQGEHPGLVVVSILPFGSSGPWAKRPATEFTLQALTGSAINRGHTSAAPLQAGGRLADWVTGAYAAVAAFAVLYRVSAGGLGEYIDASAAEVALIAHTMFHNVMISMTGAPDELVTRSTPVPSVERTADGWVGLSVNTPDQFRTYLDMIGHPELIELPNVAHPLRREPHRQQLEAAARAWLETHSTAAVVDECARRRIPVAPVHTVADLTKLPHFTERQMFSRDDAGTPVPRAPFLLDGKQLPPVEPNAGAVASRPSEAAAGDDLPLSGIRVVDMTAWWAGPCATQLLSALGATVFKVESHTRYDGMRDVSARDRTAPDYWEWSWGFHAVNTDKLGITLDLTTQAGRDAFERVLATADLLVENGSPGVLPKLGLEWDKLHERHPRLSVVRMPGFGLDGPWSHIRAYDPTISQATGVSALTGYRGGPPVVPRGFCDCTSGVHGAFAALLALTQRDVDGCGHHVESAMCDVIASILLEGVLESHDSGQAPDRSGNRGPFAAPQGIYRCSGAEQWIAIAATDDHEWQTLCRLMNRPDWAADRDLSTAAGRRHRHDELDAGIGQWCATAEAEEIASRLRASGVPAERLLTPTQALQSAQLRGRCFVEKIDHPIVGPHDYPSLPFRFASRADRAWFRSRAPMLGEHSEAVLVEQAGLTTRDFDQLLADGVVGDRPPISRSR